MAIIPLLRLSAGTPASITDALIAIFRATLRHSFADSPSVLESVLVTLDGENECLSLSFLNDCVEKHSLESIQRAACDVPGAIASTCRELGIPYILRGTPGYRPLRWNLATSRLIRRSLLTVAQTHLHAPVWMILQTPNEECELHLRLGELCAHMKDEGVRVCATVIRRTLERRGQRIRARDDRGSFTVLMPANAVGLSVEAGMRVATRPIAGLVQRKVSAIQPLQFDLFGP